jgi:hypothetical protein
MAGLVVDLGDQVLFLPGDKRQLHQEFEHVSQHLFQTVAMPRQQVRILLSSLALTNCLLRHLLDPRPMLEHIRVLNNLVQPNANHGIDVSCGHRLWGSVLMNEHRRTRPRGIKLLIGRQLLENVLDTVFAVELVLAHEWGMHGADFLVLAESVLGDRFEVLGGG